MTGQERNAYEVLRISYDTLYSPKLKWDEAKRNSKVKEKYDERIAHYKGLIDDKTSTEDVKEKARKELSICHEAYFKIATEELRTLYNKEIRIEEQKESEKKEARKRGELRSTDEKFHDLKEKYKEVNQKQEEKREEREEQKNRFEKFRKQYQYKNDTQENPYRNLKILPDDKRIVSCSKREKREILKKLRDEQLEAFQKQLKDAKDLSEKYRTIIGIHDIKRAYEQIVIEEKLNEQETPQYSHMLEYNPELIKTTQIKDEVLFKNKLLARKVEQSKVYAYEDKENRNLRLRRTATIAFFDTEGILHRVYEYQIKRTIEGKEKVDTVYTDVLIEMKEERETEKEDFIINDLFSEEMIEASKCNQGYIGSIEKDEEGKYHTTLGKDKLSQREQKILTAVIMQNQMEKEKNEVER